MAQYFLPQSGRQTLSSYFQVLSVDIPENGAPAWQGWDFPVLPPLQVQELTRAMHYDSVFWSITGIFSGNSVGNPQGLRVMIWQIHNGQQLPLFNKPQLFLNVCGSGAKSMPIKPPLFVPAGDSIMVQVSSLDQTNNLNVEIILFGNQVPAGWQMPGSMRPAATLNGLTRRRLGDAASSPTTPATAPNPYQAQVLTAKLAALNNAQSPNLDMIGDEAPYGAAPLVLGPTLSPYPAPGGNPVTIFSYQVPPGQRARIFDHALQHVGGNPPEISISGVFWSFTVNGAPLKGLGTQFAQIGAFATPARVVILLTENDLFTVTVNPGNVFQAGQSGYRIAGWTAPLLAQGSTET